MVAATILEKAAVILLVLITIALSWLWYTRKELKSWMQETWFLVKQITPLLFAGVFLAGVIVAVLPGDFVASLVGGNSISANLISSVSGSLMYFSTLTEVPIISALTKLGMGKGCTDHATGRAGTEPAQYDSTSRDQKTSAPIRFHSKT